MRNRRATGNSNSGKGVGFSNRTGNAQWGRVQGRRRCGLTILELLVSMGIIGLLASLALPAIHSVRETARRLQCSNHLHQLGIAAHAYHDSFGGLPPGWQTDATGQTAFAWATELLPYLDEDGLRRQIDWTRPLDAAEQSAARRRTPGVLMCPSDLMEPVFPLEEVVDERPVRVLVELPSASYVGVFGTSEADETPGHCGEGAFLQNRSIRFADFQRGLSNSLVIGERTARRVPSTWLGFHVAGEDAACRIVGNAFLGPNRNDGDECEFDSRHPGCVLFLWGDGRVQPVSNSVDQVAYRRMATRGINSY